MSIGSIDVRFVTVCDRCDQPYSPSCSPSQTKIGRRDIMKWCEKQTTNYGTLGRGINVTQVFEKRVEVLSKFKTHNYRRRAKGYWNYYRRVYIKINLAYLTLTPHPNPIIPKFTIPVSKSGDLGTGATDGPLDAFSINGNYSQKVFEILTSQSLSKNSSSRGDSR